MHAIHEYDIRQAFDVLDTEKDDYVTLKDLEILLLGLGFCDRTDSLVLERQLCDAVQGVSDPSQIDVETVIQIIRQHVSHVRLDDMRLLMKDRLERSCCANCRSTMQPLSSSSLLLSHATVRQYPGRNRDEFMSQSFQLVDTANKGYIDADDVIQMALDVGTPLTQKRAQRLIADTTSSTGGDKVDKQDFCQVFAPPDPS